MRILAYIILLAALGLIAIQYFGTSEIQFAWINRMNHTIEETQLATDHPLIKLYREMNSFWASSFQLTIMAAIAMFAGAVLLDLAGRKRRNPKLAEKDPQDRSRN